MPPKVLDLPIDRSPETTELAKTLADVFMYSRRDSLGAPYMPWEQRTRATQDAWIRVAMVVNELTSAARI